MAVARQRQFVRVAGKARSTDWGFGVDMLAQTLASSQKLLGTTSLTVAEQATIVRTRGILSLVLLTTNVAGGGFLGAAGIALVNSDAFSQGINSIPGPLTDSNWDAWLWHTFFDVRSVTATIADGANSNAANRQIQIDSKAMRKWDPAETLVLVVEGVETVSATLLVNCDTRILLKSA